MNYLASLAGLALSVLQAAPALAKEGDTLRPFVAYTRNYDSNLYRLAKSEQAPGLKLSDQFEVLSAGLNVDWQPGRQRVIASASKNWVRFSRNTHLDYSGSDLQLKWSWRLGNHWSGQVGATRSETQSSFSDVNLPINNQVTRENRFASAEWQFHPRWHMGLGTARSTSTNSTLQQAPSDYEDASVSATLGYTTPKGSMLRGQLRRVDGEYPNRSPSLFVDQAYSQTEYNLLGDWNTSGKLVAHGRIGYVQRENDTLSQRDFSGLNGRLSADYFPSGKTVLNWAVYREIGNTDDFNASYQLSTGTSLGGAWLATSRLTLRANATIENRSFEGDTGVVVLGTPQRDEDSLTGSLSLSYAPVRMATIDAGLQAGRRDSSIDDSDYRFHSVFVRVQAGF